MAKPNIPLSALIKVVAVVSSPALFVLAFFALTGRIDISHFLYAYVAVMVISALFVQPFLANVAALTHYVLNLSQDKKTDAPDLSVLSTLSTVGELSDSLRVLHRSWDKKRQQMESIITEREILVDTLPDILIMINDERMIVRTNRAARAIFGQNLAHHLLDEIIPNDTLINAIAAVVQDLRGQEVEFRIETPGAYDFHAVIERFPIPSASGISIIIALNDITELKRVEQMRADFVANASHEIRTPLASIKGFIETLQGPAKGDLQAHEEFLGIMAEQADRMAKLISDLLSLSKIEMTAHTLPTSKVDMLRLIRSEAEGLGRLAKDKGMGIELDLHDNLPFARGEESEIAQVLYNLISNAIKYGHSKTDVTVSAKVTSTLPSDLNFRQLSQAICISVKDRGDGIPKQHLPRLTERFYRVDSARTRAIGGTGLGLAIVKHIINRHRGALAIDSTVGEGSTFSVYLPIYQEN